MAEKMETCRFEKGQTIDKPKEIVAMRTLLIDPTDPHSLVTQYRTQWRHSDGSDSYAWSTRETIIDYLKLAKRRGQSATTFPTMKRRLQARGSRVTHPTGLREILAGRPHIGQAWPTLHAGNLTLDPTETNPEQDIANNREHHCQIRLEGELAHSYHRNGKHIGTLTKEKLLRLHERHTQAVGTTHNQTPHQSTLRTELWEDHRIKVSTFEEEVGHLLIRYSSKEEKEERKKNLQNHWTFPAQMQRALQQAFGITTELFASPLNVHHNTTKYYAKYDRDKVFGARGSAWTTNWMKLGAYQFNPEYTPQDLKKALDFAIAATTTQDLGHLYGTTSAPSATTYRQQLKPGGRTATSMWKKDQPNGNSSPGAGEENGTYTPPPYNRTGEGEAHMIRWEGEDQEVNRAELLAIQKAVTLPPPPSGKGLTICTDSANSIRQLESMRTKPHSMEHQQQRDLLYAILVNIEALVAAGHTVSLLKVKAHTGIKGNEKADEAAKQACTTGTLTEAWDNNETIKVKPMVPDGDTDSKELKGKLAVQKYVTTLLRERQAQGENRLSAKMAELQGEPTTWTHQLKKEHVFRWEAHHDQGQQTEEEQAIIRDPTPNQQQRADQAREEEDRLIKAMMEQREEEEILHMQEMQEQHEPWEVEGRTDHTQGGNPQPAEAPPQPSNEEEIFEALNELAERLEVPQGEQNDEEIFGILNELIEQQETPQGGLENERQAHHDRVTEESRVHAMMEDPAPRTRWNQRKHDMTNHRMKNRNAPPVKEGKATKNWLNKTMEHLKGDKPLHKIANGFWKRATYAARKTILKCRLRILPAQDYETAKNSAGGSGKCTLEGCGHQGVDYAKGFLIRVGHALGGCNNPRMRGMFSDRADAHADELKHILDHHIKGGCKVLAYTGKKRDPGVKPRVLPNYILTRGQCRHDGKDNPGKNDGPDTIPSFVDMVMIEGLEDLEDGWECTQREAPTRVKNLHLIEVAHTDDEKWGPKLLEKYMKYGPLLQLLRGHGFRAKLHVFAVGRTGTVYKHNQDILEQLGLNREEATQALRRIHDLTVDYAHSTYQLYRRLTQEKQEDKADETHPV
ncbi:hypothetical protein CYMTET_3412 [Cymbomonas tetramitiformis]|uniref:RNase H type-1 domain-containing protein n=1 Tax=Cymbomonas tetramitiformis TaxID=36881 RepID=A0AAE0LKV9_9CHLO|nr:hypothetical protein CYMTET_3412 [Cymbomonas tetramitiformis]